METVLVRAPNHLGDCVMALPAIHAAASFLPDNALYVLAPDWASVLYQNIPNVRLIHLEASDLHGLKAIKRQVALIRKHRFTCGGVLPPSFSSALALYLGNVRNRYGFPGEGRGIFLNHPLPPPDRIMHRSHLYMDVLSALCRTELSAGIVHLDITESMRESVRSLYLEYNLKQDKSCVVIAPRAVAESRRWGAKNYAALAGKMAERTGLRIILLGTIGEFDDGEIIAGNNPHVVNLCGKTDLGQAATILAGARLFVGNDSGLAHLASAVGTPLVVLSGADRPAETSPSSDKKTVLLKDDLDCISCVKNVCKLKGDRFMQCMHLISVNEVWDAVRQRLESGS
ncbi:MAG: lipopolysaccharide heptosyltransferase II [candidate division Zixibacteria bacterium]|nr:lipopolysaccharide heptosyltransferase II [candidate division Zixibacteria bacterium]